MANRLNKRNYHRKSSEEQIQELQNKIKEIRNREIKKAQKLLDRKYIILGKALVAALHDEFLSLSDFTQIVSLYTDKLADLESIQEDFELDENAIEKKSPRKPGRPAGARNLRTITTAAATTTPKKKTKVAEPAIKKPVAKKPAAKPVSKPVTKKPAAKTSPVPKKTTPAPTQKKITHSNDELITRRKEVALRRQKEALRKLTEIAQQEHQADITEQRALTDQKEKANAEEAKRKKAAAQLKKQQEASASRDKTAARRKNQAKNRADAEQKKTDEQEKQSQIEKDNAIEAAQQEKDRLDNEAFAEEMKDEVQGNIIDPRLHLDTVDNFSRRGRLIDTLRTAGIDTLSDLLTKRENEFSRLPGITTGTFRTCKAILNEMNLSFAN